MRRTVALALAPHRFAIVWVAIACLVTAAAAVGLAAWLARFAAPPGCLDLDIRYTPPCTGYADALEASHDWGRPIVGLLTGLPFLAGLVLGVPLVAAEVENRTAQLAWWLDPSRWRWLLVRVVVIGALLAGLLALPALAGDVLARALVPRFEAETIVAHDLGSRGAVFVGRGILTFALAILVGLVIGRVLPGLVAGGLAAVALSVVLGEAAWLWLPAPEPLRPEPDRYHLPMPGTSGIPATFVDRDGDFFTAEQIVAAAPAEPGTPAFMAWYEARGFASAIVGIPGERLWVVPTRELAGTLAATVGLVGVSAFAIRPRRPY
jgi:hypothetical protein